MGKTTLANPIDFPLPFLAHSCSFPKYLFLILSISQFFWTVKTNRIFFIENPISVIKYSLSFSWVMLLGRKPYIAYSAVKTKDIISLESDCRLRSSTNLVWQIQVEINTVFRKSIQGRGTSFLITKIPQMFCRMEEENPTELLLSRTVRDVEEISATSSIKSLKTPLHCPSSRFMVGDKTRQQQIQ